MLVAMVAVIARAEVAHACSCAAPRIVVSPEGVDAPVNATIVAWVPTWRRAKAPDVALSLRKKNGATVEVDSRKLGAADQIVFELTPKAKLAPNTEYEVFAEGEASPVGSFKTGTQQLATAPNWKGVASTDYFQDKAVCCDCSTSDPYAVVELQEKITDDKLYRVAIWMAGADGKIDYKKPPTTYARGSTMYLGHPSTCGTANFVFPKQKALKLGFKLVDLAGNASGQSEFVIDTTKPNRSTRN